MPGIDVLIVKVTKITTVRASASALIEGIVERLRDDEADVDEIASDLDSNMNALAKAVADGTRCADEPEASQLPAEGGPEATNPIASAPEAKPK